MDAPTAFITLDAVKTFAGQVMAVGMLTQVIKSAVPASWVTPYRVRTTAVLVGIGIHLLLGWQASMPPAEYALALLNGVGVALAAMKAAEIVGS